MGSKEKLKQFDVVSDVSKDHHFFHKKQKVLSKCTQKRIAREWLILQKHLPQDQSIYVRVYDTRMDLIRAAIVGPAGTPYHDALFFFDIQFPSTYPCHPPSVVYRSHGLSLNPNLYPNGTVCLSLLSTCPARLTSEMWDPPRSTILQVLVSIQALVLNEKPYYNNVPGRWEGSERKSQAYNEHVFLCACMIATYSLRKKPGGFEFLVLSHYTNTAGRILCACRAYVAGRATIGFYGEASAPPPACHVSERFVESMDVIYKNLVWAFRHNQIVVDPRLEGLSDVVAMRRESINNHYNNKNNKAWLRGERSGNNGSQDEKKKKKKTSGGIVIVKKVVKKFKEVMGFK